MGSFSIVEPENEGQRPIILSVYKRLEKEAFLLPRV